MRTSILFPVDFSPQCASIADYVSAMVIGKRAHLMMLHVMEYPPWLDGETDADRFSSLVDVTLMKERRQEVLDSYLCHELGSSRPVRVLAQGDPATEIVRFAEREGVSLIMTPSYGAGAFRPLLIGSVAAKVLHDASCPVWINAHAEHVVPARYPAQSVIAAVDLSAETGQVIRWASRFAAEQNAKLHAVHAVSMGGEEMNQGVMKVREHLQQSARDEWAKLQKDFAIHLPLVVSFGSAGPAVRRAAHDLGADVVIIGRGHLSVPAGKLRTSSYAIIRESPCPVIRV
jgi:nucleotide-binding universal stress UspA family protein